MSDERQAFEQLHAIPTGAEWCDKRHIYIHKNYSGLVLHPINESWEAFCEGAIWQASRQGVGGDSESIIGFHNALQRVKKIFSEYRQDWPKWGKRLDGTPALNDLPVRIAAAFSELYTHPASSDKWIKCSERMPTVNDADFDGYVWWARFNHVARTKQRIVVDGLEHLDDAFWMPTNLTLTQPQPPNMQGRGSTKTKGKEGNKCEESIKQ